MDPNNALGNPIPTNINAFRADLDQAEADLALAQGRVDGLKAKIAEMEAAGQDSSAVAPANAPSADVEAQAAVNTTPSNSTPLDVPLPDAPPLPDANAPADAPVPSDNLSSLNRPDLESAAEDAGVENPSNKEALPNKATLVDATQAAQDSQAVDPNAVPAADATNVPVKTEEELLAEADADVQAAEADEKAEDAPAA